MFLVNIFDYYSNIKIFYKKPVTNPQKIGEEKTRKVVETRPSDEDYKGE